MGGRIAGSGAHVTTTDAEAPLSTDVEVLIVGAGFSGLGLALRLLDDGRDFLLLEAGASVGGTWRDNTYPGCACDIPSHLYSYSFRPNARWTRHYSRQPEILDYLRRCAEAPGLDTRLRLRCRVTDAHWDEEAKRWHVRTSRGPVRARWLVLATGPLSDPAIPRLPGLARFAGPTWHSARWNHDTDLRGARVAVVGTGASAIQFVPELQKLVGELHLYQRSAPWIVPRGDGPIGSRSRALLGGVPGLRRALRAATYVGLELTLPVLLGSRRPVQAAETLARRHLLDQVADPELRARLTPDYSIGCKRILSSDDYYPAVSQPNVELVTSPIRAVDERGLRTADGAHRQADVIVYGTGFEVAEPAITRLVRGRHGISLAEIWRGSPIAHRGTTVHGFPNMFLLLGPNTGLGHNSVILMAEAQFGYILQALGSARAGAITELEVTSSAQAEWNAWLDRRSAGTVWLDGHCTSWYLDQSGRNTSIWPGSAAGYRTRMRHFDRADYRVGRDPSLVPRA